MKHDRPVFSKADVDFRRLFGWRMAVQMQVSRTPRTPFDWRAALPGVGEALKREIAGMFLVGQPGLWGFEDYGCFAFSWE